MTSANTAGIASAWQGYFVTGVPPTYMVKKKPKKKHTGHFVSTVDRFIYISTSKSNL